MMAAPDSEQLAAVVVDQLLAAGVSDVVLAPGSRSAPLAYAVWAAGDRLRLHVRIDERSAGFLALGLARASGRPVAVVTTSGTAAGNLLPAVMEAWHSRLPLVAVTADRPATMVHTGASQTSDQLGLYGGHVRAEARLSAADAQPRAWAFALARTLAAATGRRGGVPGPVHVNAAFVDPLVPAGATGSLPLAPTVDPAPGPADPVLLPAGTGTVLVAGDLTPYAGRRVAGIAARAGIPLFAEPSSNARHSAAAISTYRLLLGTELGATIRRVIMVGRPTLSRPVLRLLRRDDVELVVVDPTPEWIDPGLHASRVVAEFALPDDDPGDAPRWRAADDRVLAGLAAEPQVRDGRLAPGVVARAVAAAQGSLVLGASNPIRDLDLVRFAATAGETLEVHASRGLAGIDGTVSTAYGIALARPERATTAYLGDLTFLHDQNGLVVGPDEPRPEALRYVVANDDGGSIFATLEHGHPDRASSFERLFGTAHRVDLAAVCAATGTRHTRVAEPDHLAAVLASPVTGVEVVEAVVDRTDRPAQTARWQSVAEAAV